MAQEIRSYLKRHTEALVKDVGVEAACEVVGKSKATLGRYYSSHEEHSERFMPVDTVALLEDSASYPHVTAALAELAGLTVSANRKSNMAERSSSGQVNEDIAVISQRFAMLMSAYANAIADNIITPNEARELLAETLELQKVLVEMKLHLEAEAQSA
ncbi:MAG: hypothetical protein AAFY65_03320 [Pseudomonadota bacterium]